MLREVFVVKNNTVSDIELKDFGLIIAPDVTIDLINYDLAVMSDELNGFLMSGDLVRYIDGIEITDPQFLYNTTNNYYLAAEQYGNVINVAKTGSSYTTINSVLDLITGNTADNRYVIQLSPDVFEENITVKPYVTIQGISNYTKIKGKITIDFTGSTNTTIFSNLEIENYEDESVLLDTEGFVIFNNTNISSRYTVPSGRRVKSVLNIKRGTINIGGISIFSLYNTNTGTTNNVDTIYQVSGSGITNLISLSATHNMTTYEKNTYVSVLYNENINTETDLNIRNGFGFYYINNNNPFNKITPVLHSGATNNSFLSTTRFHVNAPNNINGVKIIAAYNTKSYIVESDITSNYNTYTWNNNNISDESIFIGAATTYLDNVRIINCHFKTFTDYIPTRYDVDGGNGDITYAVTNNRGSQTNFGQMSVNSLFIGNISGTTINTILNEENLISNRSDALPTQHSVKKYVDDQISGITPTSYVTKVEFHTYTGTTGLQEITEINAVTNIESKFSSGIVTSKIRPSGDTTSAIQIDKADGITPLITINTVSGFTGHGVNNPLGLVHAYGTDNVGSLLSTQTNALIIDGAPDVDKDVAWYENGTPKWLAETYRNEDSNFWYLYNVESDNSPLTIMETGRIGVNKQTNFVDYHAVQIVGSGLNNMVCGGGYTQNYNTIYEIEIITSGTPDTYHWKKSLDNGITYGSWITSGNCSLTETELEFGVTIYFETTTGHTAGQMWRFAAFTQIPQATFTIAPMAIKEVQKTEDFTASPIIYEDITAFSNGGLAGQTFTIFNTGVTGIKQALYLGFQTEINSIYIDLTTVSDGSIILYTEFWDGTDWVTLTSLDNNYIDGTSNLTKSGKIIWTPRTMIGWIAKYLPDLVEPGYELLWIRFITSSNPTVSPIANSLSIGNDKRFAVYSAFNDYRPAFYVDARGRVNIGGGNITGSNKLQVNTGNNVTVTATGTDSLVEFDSENSGVTDLKIKLSSSDIGGPGLTFVKTRGTLDTSSSTEYGDILGHISFRGRAGTSGRLLADIGAVFMGSGTTRYGDIYFKTANGSDPVEVVRMTSSGTTGFGISAADAVVHIKAGTTTVAPLKFTSGSLLVTPQTGTIEFVNDAWYGTITSGSVRKTFAFLESPQFIGTPNLPSGTTLNLMNLNDYILTSGGSNSTLFVLNSVYNTYTGTTVPNTYVTKVTYNSYTGTTGLNEVTHINAYTNVQSSFYSGVVTHNIKMESGNTFQINNSGNTPIITINESGFTGYDMTDPLNQLHIYGKDTSTGDLFGFQSNGIRITGDIGTDKQIAWDSRGKVKWMAEIYRNEKGKYWYLWSQENNSAPIVASQGGRIGINNASNIMNYHVLKTIGINEGLDVSGLYNKNFLLVYQVQINSNTGVTDTFIWRESKDGGVTYGNWSIESNIVSSAITFDNGVILNFGQQTGNTIGDRWEFGAYPQLPLGTMVITPVGFNEIQTTDNYTTNPIIYEDQTAYVQNTDTSFSTELLETGTTDSAFYIGALVEFDSVFFNLITVGAGITLVAEYWDGSVWTDISIGSPYYIDNTSNLSQSGEIIFDSTILTGWAPYYMTDLVEDGYELFWMRFRSVSPPTIQPLVNNIVRAGNKRFAVNTSPLSYRPEFYIDSLGRVNIGGGTITGGNKLQINTHSNLPVGVSGRDSLVEFDSENQLISDLKIKLSSDDSYDTGIIFVKTRGTLLNPTSTQTGDYIGHIQFRGRFNTSGSLLAQIQGQFTGTESNRNGDLIFSTANNAVISERVRIISSGYTGFGVNPTAIIHIKSGDVTVAPLKFTSGSLLSSPQVGAVEFLTDAFYGTITTGAARKTFAFLESPQFTGTPNLPSGTTLNSENLYNFILTSGGTSGTGFVSISTFNSYTGVTDGEITSLSTSISSETSTRGSTDSSLSVNISSNTSKEVSLSTSISSETSNRSSVDSSLSISISGITLSDTSLSTAISTEASTRSSVDSSLSTADSTETSIRNSADSSLSTSVSTETSTRSSVDSSLSTSISTNSSLDSSLSVVVSTETSTRGSADNSLSSSISQSVTGITSLSTANSTETSVRGSVDTSLSIGISTEVSTRGSVDSSLSVTISQSITGVTSLSTGLSQSITGVTSLSTGLSQSITGITSLSTRISQSTTGITSLSTRISQSTTGITSLSTGLSQSITGITSLSTAVSTETSNRISGDTSLSTAVSIRISVDNSLSTADSTEVSIRSSADSSLSVSISTSNSSIISNTTRISTEESIRSSADLSLSTSISQTVTGITSLSTADSTEVSIRSSADSSLSVSISTISSTTLSSDYSLSVSISQSITGITSLSTGLSQSITGITSLSTADSSLSTSISTNTSTIVSNTTRISTEESTRSSVDSSLSIGISQSVTGITSLSTGISSESSTRSSVDSSLSTVVSTEISIFNVYTGSTIPWTQVSKNGSSIGDLVTRNASDVNYTNIGWDVTNISDGITKLTGYLEDTQGSGRLSPEVVLGGSLTSPWTTLYVSGGTGYITYTGYHKLITWSGATYLLTGYTEGYYYVYVDTNSTIQIAASQSDSIHNVRLGSFYWDGNALATIQQSGTIMLNSESRLANYAIRSGVFIYDNGGTIAVSGSSLKIISTPCKVQYGLLDQQLPQLTSDDAASYLFALTYNSSDVTWELDYHFGRTNGSIPNNRWNDVTKKSYNLITGVTVSFTNGSTLVTSATNLTGSTYDLIDAFIYKSTDGASSMTPVSSVTWTGSATNITLETPYTGTTGSGTMVANYTLPKIPTDKYVKHLIIRTTDNQMFLILAQTYYNDNTDASNGVLPSVADALLNTGIKMAGIVVNSGTTDLTGNIYDIRPLPYQYRLGGQTGGGVTITSHGQLTGLGADDHLQYQRTDGTRNLTGIEHYQSHPTFTTDTDLIDKKYVDDADILKVNLTTYNTYTGTTNSSMTSLSTATSTEVSTRGSVDSSLSTSISTETSLRTSGDTSLSIGISTRVSVDSSLSTSITGVTSSMTSLSTTVSTEVSTRGSGDTSLSIGLSTEVSTRTSSVTSLSTVVSTEVSTRGSADLSLSTSISTEVSTRTSGDTSLSTAVSTEVSLRTSGDTSLSIGISTRVSVDTSLSTGISTEVSTRGSVDSSLSTSISQSTTGITSLSTIVSTEVSNRTSGDTSLSIGLSTEISTRGNVDSSLSTSTSTISSSTTSSDLSLSTSISTINSSASSSDSSLSSSISTNNSLILSNTTRISTEESTRGSDDSSLSTSISTGGSTDSSLSTTISQSVTGITSLSTANSTEASTRSSADSSLSTSVSSEISTRSSGDSSLSTSISTEVSLRTSGDTSLSITVSSNTSKESSLSTSISTESSLRTSVDASLSTTISGLTVTSLSIALSTEISTRGSGDTSLSIGLSTEISTRTSGDTSLSIGLSTHISTNTSTNTSLSTSISTETSLRISGDTSLSTAVSSEVSNRIISNNGKVTKSGDTMTGDLTINTNLYVKGNISLPTIDSKIIANTGLIFEQSGDTYGTTRMYLQNRNGVNGMMFQQAGSVDVTDFVFSGLTSQRNIRLENRTTSPYGTLALPLFKIGGLSPDVSTLYLADNGGALMNGNFGVNTLSPAYTFDISGTSRTTGASRFESTVTITGTLGITGITYHNTISKYNADYSGSYDIRTLVDKGYVDSGLNLKAPFTSPSLSGTPTSTTAAVNTNTTQIATTAFVVGQASATNPLMDGTVAIGTSLRYSREDHVHASDTSRLSVTAFNTYTGTTEPTLYVGLSTYNTFTGTTNTNISSLSGWTGTKLDTSLFNTYTTVTAPSSFVSKSTFNTYTGDTTTALAGKQATITGGAITITGNTLTVSRALISNVSGNVAVSNTTSTQIDYLSGLTSDVQAQINLKSPIASPTFTGTPASTTAAVNTNTTQIATTAFVVGQAGTANPLVNNTVAVGTSLLYSRQDHVHPIDTTRVNKSGDTMTGTLNGTSLNLSGDLGVTGSTYLYNTTEGVSTTQYVAQIDSVTKKVGIDTGITSTYYGQNFHWAEDLTNTNTSATSTGTTKISMTTASLPTGVYKVTVSWLWRRTGNGNTASFDLALNGTSQDTTVFLTRPVNAADYNSATRVYHLSLSGVNTILLRYWGSSSGNATYMSDATMELVRVA